jgi:membrane associated rhomboid family serine protease
MHAFESRTFFPAKSKIGWSEWQSGKEIDIDYATLAGKVSKWFPTSGHLIGEPEGNWLLPPVLIPILQSAAIRSVRRQSRNYLIAVLIMGIVFSLPIAFPPHSRPYSAALLAFLFAAIMLNEHRNITRSIDRLKERAIFYAWMRRSKNIRRATQCWFVIGLSVGITQAIALFILGGLDETFYFYGLVYSKVAEGEVWRFLSGPYLHYSLAHYSINFLLLLIIGPLASSAFGVCTFALFFVSASLSAWAQWYLGPDLLDICGGISGGVYALFGATATTLFFRKKYLPEGMPFLIGSMSLHGIASAEVLSSTAATTAHFAGIVVGSIFSFIYDTKYHARNSAEWIIVFNQLNKGLRPNN